MSEDQLKKFRLKLLKLLPTNGSQISSNRMAEIFKEYSDQDTLPDMLVRLGLHDIHAVIESFRGQDIRSYLTDNIPIDSLVWEYWQSVFPVLDNRLKQLEHHSIVSPVRNFLQNLQKQLEVWQAMLEAVQNQDFFPVMSAMMDNYPQQSPELQKITISALKKVGTPVVLALIHSLHKNNGQSIHKDLPKLLREMGTMAIPALVVALQYPDDDVRYSAAEVLDQMQSTESVPGLIESLQDPVPRIRRLVCHTLGEIGDVRALASLVHALNDRDSKVRLEATKSIGRLQHPSTLSALASLLQDSDWEVRKATVEALACFGTDAATYLGKALENDSIVVRKISARMLTKIGTSQTVPALMKAMSDKDISVREHAIIALGRIQKEESLVMLMKALEDKAPLVRFAAVQVIISIGSRSMLHLLNRALKDSEHTIRQRANFAIQEILKKEKIQIQRTNA